MIETAVALFAAHVIADFVLQVRWIIDNKHRPGPFLAHVAIVAATSAFLLGAWSGAALAAVAIVTVSHAVIDRVKLGYSKKPWVREHPRGTLVLFLSDQALHVLAIVLTAWYLREAWSQSWWTTVPETWQTGFLTLLCLVTGFILATRAGGFVIGMSMEGFVRTRSDSSGDESSESGEPESDQGLVHGGKWIGLLERALIFVLIMAQEFQAIGFLIAAKSILRFQYSKERSHSETVIIGTLASFAWAIVVSWGTFELIELLNSATASDKAG